MSFGCDNEANGDDTDERLGGANGGEDNSAADDGVYRRSRSDLGMSTDEGRRYGAIFSTTCTGELCRRAERKKVLMNRQWYAHGIWLAH